MSPWLTIVTVAVNSLPAEGAAGSSTTEETTKSGFIQPGVWPCAAAASKQNPAAIARILYALLFVMLHTFLNLW